MRIGNGEYDPDFTEVTLQARLTTSPTLSLSNPDDTLDVMLGLRISKTKNPGEPITILTDFTAFEAFTGVGRDIFWHNRFTALQALDSNNQPTDKIIRLSPGYRINWRMNRDSLDLRAFGRQFLTIPGDGSEVTIIHRLSWKRIFEQEDELSKDDLRPGERFIIEVVPRFIRTDWWCIGDLEGDLKDKKFHPGELFSDLPPDDYFVQEGGWVWGRDLEALHWKMEKSDMKAIFEIVE